MKKAFTVLLFVSSTVLQGMSQDVLVRRIRQQIDRHPQIDTFRVNRLNQLAALDVTASEKDSLSQQALRISRTLNYQVGEGFALINQASAAGFSGDKSTQLRYLQQALSIAEKMQDKHLLVTALMASSRAMISTQNKLRLELLMRADAIAETLPDKELLASCQGAIAAFYETSLSNYPKAMEWVLKSISTAEQINSLDNLVRAWTTLAQLYDDMGDEAHSLIYCKKALDASIRLEDKRAEYNLLNDVGERYRLMGNFPEAIKAYEKARTGLHDITNIEVNESNRAYAYVGMNDLKSGFKYAFSALKGANSVNDIEGVAWIDGILGTAYNKSNKPDSAIYYAKQGLNMATETGTTEYMRDNSRALYVAFDMKKDYANAFKYLKLYTDYQGTLANAQVTNRTTLLKYNFDMQKKQAEIAALAQQKKTQRIILISTLSVLALIAVIVVVLLRSNRHKQAANAMLSKQKEEVQLALAELKSTQAQLIQREKMASLGELTAGIAHEIQNPLNFVNNFSDVNREMIDELEQELKSGNIDEALLITADLKDNEQKVSHHGKRADAIVKGMLQHSRTSSGQKESTDLNGLADEYLRLAYHGFQAKDKEFNAELITNFDTNLPKVDVIPQDIGRVLLNVINNAFYATQQKSKITGADYKPTVEVITTHENRSVLVYVKDNGIGIPENIREKIMQPFFTTKPTGEGTGLGLSLAYEIVVKVHGGSIDVHSLEGIGSDFKISFPVN